MFAKMIQVIIISLLIFPIGFATSEGQLNYKPIKPSVHSYPEIPRITAFEAKSLFDEGKLVLASVDEPDEFKIVHIIGSVNIPSGQAQNFKLPTNIMIAFY